MALETLKTLNYVHVDLKWLVLFLKNVFQDSNHPKHSRYIPLELKWLTYFSNKYYNIQMTWVISFQIPNTFNALKEIF